MKLKHLLPYLESQQPSSTKKKNLQVKKKIFLQWQDQQEKFWIKSRVQNIIEILLKRNQQQGSKKWQNWSTLKKKIKKKKKKNFYHSIKVFVLRVEKIDPKLGQNFY
jgi:hypothetical protein